MAENGRQRAIHRRGAERSTLSDDDLNNPSPQPYRDLERMFTIYSYLMSD